MRMLRSAVIVTQRNVVGRRSLVTSQQKRILKKEGSAASIPSATSTPPPPPPPNTSSGGSSALPLLTVAAIGAAGGGAYYMGYLPPIFPTKDDDDTTSTTVTAVAAAKEEIASVTTEEATTNETVNDEKMTKDETTTNVKDKESSTTATTTTTTTTTEVTTTPVPAVNNTDDELVGNRVTVISVPPVVDRPPQIVPEPTYLDNANRVSMIPASTTKQQQQQEEDTTVADAGSLAKEAILNELLSNKEGADDDDSTTTANLSVEQLRWRVVQLTLELKERTRWEAVRLQEYLKRKESELSHHYMELLQKQRLEMEQVLSNKLLQQEEALTRNAHQLLQQKDQSISSLVQAATDALKEEHNAELASMQDRLTNDLSAQYQMEHQNQLAAVKKDFQAELTSKVQHLEALTKQVLELQSWLQKSQQYQEKSLTAHGVSAAALAMVDQSQTNQPVAQQVAALSRVATHNPVISSALSSLPSSALANGIPTLSDLQSHFVHKVYPSTRQVAFVPEGRVGLGGQLMGKVLATLTVPPSPEENEETHSNKLDHTLARAKRFVELGQLDSAIQELDTLEGPTAFVARDWKQAALNRLHLDKAIHIIQLECAILNQTMTDTQ